MKWLLGILGGMVLAIGIVAAIGAMLPVRHHVSRRARFCVAPAELYAILSGPPDWRSEVKGYGELPADGVGRRWFEQDGHGRKVVFEQVEARPPERLRVRIADQGLPFGGAWTYAIAPVADGGSELRIAEDGEVYNVVFRFLARFVFGHQRSIEQYFRDLGAKLGQTVEIEA